MIKEQITNFEIETPDVETSSDDYASRFSGKIGEWFLKIQEKATLKMMAEWSGASVLDVGGGHGQLTGPLLQNGFDVTVLGSADECENRIREYTESDKCHFKVGNVLELPFKDNSFDIVVSFRLVPHINQWDRLLSEFARVARKAVIVDYPSKRSINCLTPLLFNVKKKYEKNTRHYISFSDKEIIESFELHGFTANKRYPEFFLPMVLHRALKCPPVSAFFESVSRLLGLTSLFGSPIILKLTPKDGETK